MCSIEGFTGKHDFSIQSYSSFNKDRGPDDSQYFEDSKVSLGHNLLKISPNNTKKSQPYVTDKGNVLCFNGAIYGIDDKWDTEWLANRIESDGITSLRNGVNGQWAFTWYEQDKQRIWFVRDHFGQKPLYYVKVDGNLFWSSTPKPLYAVLNKYSSLEVDSLDFQLYNSRHSRFHYGKHFPYARIRRVPPGFIMMYDLREKQFTATDTLWGKEVHRERWNLDMNLKWDPEELEEEFVLAFNEVYDHGPGIKKTCTRRDNVL